MKKSQSRLAVRASPITHSAITAAVIQPITLSHGGKVKRAITWGLLAELIITAMMGGCHHAVDDCAPIQCPTRVDRHEVYDCADRGGCRESGVTNGRAPSPRPSMHQ
jgi:hypothetical protein